jgi:hypothetical protein
VHPARVRPHATTAMTRLMLVPIHWAVNDRLSPVKAYERGILGATGCAPDKLDGQPPIKALAAIFNKTQLKNIKT